MSVEAGPRKTTSPNADTRTRSEGATLVFAVTVAVALGVACGIWINSLMATASPAARDARPRPEPTPAAEPAPPKREDPPAPSGEAEAAEGPAETADAEALKTDPGVGKDEGRASKRDDGAASHAARGASRLSPEGARRAVTPDVERGATPERAQVRSSPCALYASAGALTVRAGGAAPLVLGGPGESARVNLTTPDWSNIAVLYEGRAGNGWLRYTVRSVSGRPGAYTLRFATPCGSKTIPVTVR
jgi:hypothetical protein